MTFSFLASNTLEVLHFSGYNWRTNKTNVVQLSYVTTTLVVLDEYLDILYILKFHVAQVDLLACQIFGIQSILGKKEKIFKKQNNIEKYFLRKNKYV